MSRYKTAFYEYGFDSLDAVATITKRDLEKLKVKTGHRRIILKAVTEAKAKVEAKKQLLKDNEKKIEAVRRSGRKFSALVL